MSYTKDVVYDPTDTNVRYFRKNADGTTDIISAATLIAELTGGGTGTITTNNHTLALSADATIGGTNTGDQTAGTGLTLTAGAFSVNAAQAITRISNLTTNGLVTTSGADGTLSVSTASLPAAITGSSLTSVGTITSGTWSGSFGAVSGANLTTLNASNISSGTLADARLPAAVANITSMSALGTISSGGAITISSGGTNQPITLTGVGTGKIALVNASASQGFTVKSTASSSYCEIALLDTSGTVQGTFGYGNTGTSAPWQNSTYMASVGSNPFVVTVNSTERFRANTTGAVVTGALTVTGAVGIGAAPTSPFNLDISGSGNRYLRVIRGDNSSDAAFVASPSGTLTASNVSWNYGLNFLTANSFMFWEYNGSTTTYPMGIGNTGIVAFGGTSTTTPFTSSFPAIKRSGTTLAVRLADDSADAPITASNVTASGTLAVTGTSTLTGGIIGTVAGGNATAGNVGEYVSSLVASGSAVSLTNATTANVTSISLTAGDWDVEGTVSLLETLATTTTRSAGLTSTSATTPTDGSEAYCGTQSTLTTEVNSIPLTRKRFSISGTTTIYLVTNVNFSAGTVGAFGSLNARRTR